jgi:hypothetical protein
MIEYVLTWVRAHRFIAGGVAAAALAIAALAIVSLTAFGGDGGDEDVNSTLSSKTESTSTGGDITPSTSPATPGAETDQQATPSPTARSTPDGDEATAPPTSGGGSNQEPAGGGPSPSDDNESSAPTRAPVAAQPTPRPVRTVLPPEPLSIRFTAPASGATVPPTFNATIEATGLELALGPGGAYVPGAGHWHLGIDQHLEVEPRAVRTARIGPLSPGRHTLSATLNLNDADATVVAIAQITITVE